MQGMNKGTVIHTSLKPERPDNGARPEIRPKKLKRRAPFSERLLRNTAIACALLLGILTLKNIDTPWSQAAVNGIETALTMRIDPDSTLGDLSFVRSFVPESTLVFLNAASAGPVTPVEGNVLHEYLEGQPWILYSCEDRAEVRSALAGTVSAVSRMESGEWCVLIDHGSGVETMYAYLDKPDVDAGDSVARGGSIGRLHGDTLYYEYRLNGVSTSAEGKSGR